MRPPLIRLLLCIGVVGAIPAIKRQIQTGIVPIFDPRLTREPITFTFTTPRNKLHTTTTKPINIAYPTLRPSSSFSDVDDVIIHNNVRNFDKKQYSVYDKDGVFQFVDLQELQISTPIYNQAQYYKAMQQALQKDVSSSYRAIWQQMGDTWVQLKSQLMTSGVDRDWRMLWQHFTGAVEPYMNSFGEQLGKLINTFLKQQQIRVARKNDLVRNYKDARSSRDVKSDVEEETIETTATSLV